MPGDGLIRPANAPRAAIPAPGVQPGNSSAVVVANRVIIIGPSGGEFIYSPSFGFGNLIGSDTAQPGTDGAGNAFLGGLTKYEPGAGFSQLAVNINGDKVTWFRSATGAAGPYTEVAHAAYVTLTGALSISSTSGTINMVSNGGETFFDNGVLTAADPNLSGTPETWHAMTPLAAGFAAGGTSPRFQLYPDGTVGLSGAVNLTATQAAGARFFTLITGYIPSRTFHFVQQASLSGNAVGSATVQVIGGTGQLQIGVAGGAGGFVTLDGIRFELN